MANNCYPIKDEVVYRKGVGLREYSYFDDMFYIKKYGMELRFLQLSLVKNAITI